jgi:hypothetical protein
LTFLRDRQHDHFFGILSSHAAALRATLRACGQCLDEFDANLVLEQASGLMEFSPVEYVRSARLRGISSGHVNHEGSVCCADTGFWVDHTEPIAAVAEVVKQGTNWPFGELIDGCELLLILEARCSFAGTSCTAKVIDIGHPAM